MAGPQNLRGIGELFDAINAPKEAEKNRKARAIQQAIAVEKALGLQTQNIEANKDATLLADSLKTKENIRLDDIEETKYNQRVEEENETYKRRVIEADKKVAIQNEREDNLKKESLIMSLLGKTLNKEAQSDAGKYQNILAKVQRMKDEQSLSRNFQPNANKLRRNAGEFFTESKMLGTDEEDILEGYQKISGDTFQGGGGNTFDGISGLVNKGKLYDPSTVQNKQVRSLIDTYLNRMNDLGYSMGEDGNISGVAEDYFWKDNDENTAQMHNIVRQLLGFKEQLNTSNPYKEFGISDEEKKFYDSYDFGQGTTDKEIEVLKSLLNSK
jgi:hypothetical protein